MTNALVQEGTKLLYPNFDKEFNTFLQCLIELGVENAQTFRDAKLVASIKNNFLEMFESKRALKEHLGLDDDYRLRLVLEDTKDTSRNGLTAAEEVLYLFLNSYYMKGKIDPDPVFSSPTSFKAAIADNKITLNRRTMRLSKYLVKIVDPEDWAKIRIPSHLIDKVEHKKWDTFLNEIFEVSNMIQRPFIFSLNPFDLMFSANYASFDTCHNLVKNHGKGNLAYARHPLVGIGFSYSDKTNEFPFHKIARNMVYISEDYLKITIGRLYPKDSKMFEVLIDNFSKSMIDKLHSKVPEQLGSKWHLFKNEHISPEFMARNSSLSNIYFDPDTKRIVIHDSVFDANKLLEENLSPVEFPSSSALCMACGKPRLGKDDTKLICRACNDVYCCQRCGNNVSYANSVIIPHGGGFFYACKSCANEEYALYRDLKCINCDSKLRDHFIHWARGTDGSKIAYCLNCSVTMSKCRFCTTLFKTDNKNITFILNYSDSMTGKFKDRHAVCNICPDCRSNKPEHQVYIKNAGFKYCKNCSEKTRPTFNRRDSGRCHQCSAIL